MSEPMANGGEMLARVGRHWGWGFGFGIFTLVAGIVVLAWPGATLLVIAVLFGIQLIVAGIFRFVAAIAVDDGSGGMRVLMTLLRVLSIILGFRAVRHALLTLLALAVLLGIFWVVNGAIELFTALAHQGLPNRGWTGAMGALSIVSGIIVLSYPGLSLLTLSVVLGIGLLVYGVMEIVASFRLRKLAEHSGPRPMAHAH